MSLVRYRSGKHLMLYTVNDGKNLKQHEYTISQTNLDSINVVSLISLAGHPALLTPGKICAIISHFGVER